MTEKGDKRDSHNGGNLKIQSFVVFDFFLQMNNVCGQKYYQIGAQQPQMFPSFNKKEQSHNRGRGNNRSYPNEPSEMGLSEHYTPIYYPPPMDNYLDPSLLRRQPIEYPLPPYTDPHYFMNMNFDEGQNGYDEHPPYYSFDGPYQRGQTQNKNWYSTDEIGDIKRQGQEQQVWRHYNDRDEDSPQHEGFIKQQIPHDMEKINPDDVNQYLQAYGAKDGKENQRRQYRRMRVQKFLQKKKQRTFKKKITYHCRKQVAEGRLRHKGRFLSKKQAQMKQNEKQKEWERTKLIKQEEKSQNEDEAEEKANKDEEKQNEPIIREPKQNIKLESQK